MSGFHSLLPRPVEIVETPGACAWPAPVAVRFVTGLPAEGYRLEITPGAVSVLAADDAGEFYARQTLRQLIGPDAFRAVAARAGSLPCGIVTDYPRFPWRGCLLDVARHFRPKHEVLRFIDQLAAHKINVLHLHLTDDQGWRIEIPRFPKLTEIGSWRRESMVGRHDGPQRDGRPHGGFYPVADLKEIVAYARERAITIVPEIDIPGHARAAIASYPELGGRPVEVWTSWGISQDLLAPGQATLDFFRAVFDEVLEIFPGEVISVGGDEVPGATPEHGRFLAEIIEHLRSRGRRVHVWDDVLDAGIELPGDVIVGAWRDGAADITGYDTVLCPEQHVYLDHRQSDHPDEPIPVGYLRTLEDFYAYEPGDGVLGCQAQVWTEHLDTARRVDYATFPRLCAFAEVVWSPREGDYEEFLPRLREHHLPRLDALGVEYRPIDGPLPWQTRPGVPGRPR